MFETENRVCVVYPTGCGKSFISLKWLEENKEKRAIFLALTVSILRQITKHIESCEMISHFYNDLREKTLVKFTQTRKKEDETKIETFKISDTVRQIQDIFRKIDNSLSLSLDDYYALAVQYYKEHGNLLVPMNYSKNGMNLGVWINEKRKAMKGHGHGRILTEEQIQKLDAIGMV